MFYQFYGVVPSTPRSSAGALSFCFIRIFGRLMVPLAKSALILICTANYSRYVC